MPHALQLANIILNEMDQLSLHKEIYGTSKQPLKRGNKGKERIKYHGNAFGDWMWTGHSGQRCSICMWCPVGLQHTWTSAGHLFFNKPIILIEYANRRIKTTFPSLCCLKKTKRQTFYRTWSCTDQNDSFYRHLGDNSRHNSLDKTPVCHRARRYRHRLTNTLWAI